MRCGFCTGYAYRVQPYFPAAAPHYVPMPGYVGFQPFPDYPPLPPDRVLALPMRPADYARFWVSPLWKWWRGLCVIGAAIVGFVVVTLLVIVVWDVSVSVINIDFSQESLSVQDFTVTNIAIALGVPFAFLTAWIFTRQKPGYLSSVVGHFRWRWFLLVLVPGMVVFAVWITVIDWLPGIRSGAYQLQTSQHTWPLIAIILLTTPFQCAAEEYAFRGLLFRSFSGFFRHRRFVGPLVGATVSSLVFVSGHDLTSGPMRFVSLFIFAMCACYVTWRTGGLEAAITIHIGNNFAAESTMPFLDITADYPDNGLPVTAVYLSQIAVDLICVAIIETLVRYRPQIRWAAPGLQELPPGLPVPPEPVEKFHRDACTYAAMLRQWRQIYPPGYRILPGFAPPPL